MNELCDLIKQTLDSNPGFTSVYTGIVRIVFIVISVLFLTSAVLSLFRLPREPEIFARLCRRNAHDLLLTHWENIIGRSRSADLTIHDSSLNRLHAVISRDEEDRWHIYDLDSKCGTMLNGHEIDSEAKLHYGDIIFVGNTELTFQAISEEERRETNAARKLARPVSPWGPVVILTIMQALLCFQLVISKQVPAARFIIPTFLAFTIVMWAYFIVMHFFKLVGYELELIAFFLTTISLSVTTSCNYKLLYKQLIAVICGIVLFLGLGILLKDLSLVKKLRWFAAAAGIGLLGLTLVLGHAKYGATNWIRIGDSSFQPSEIAKLCYIFAGASTLDRLFRKRNLGLFMVMSFIMMMLLGLMSDFGGASIFFITFLVISYLRSGDFATILLLSGGAVSGGIMILIAKPYIWNRFSTWRHAWEYASSGGYQQVRTMTAIASGGLFGVGPGAGFLKRVAASDTDLVFGLVCEEWGLIVGILIVGCIIALAAFAIRSCEMSHSSYYSIAACSATSMIIFQTALNIFGSVDMLPLTGVTFPFVSNGGSSMMFAWGLLAFLKATDTRPNASFANAVYYRRRRAKKSAAQSLQASDASAGGDRREKD
ncbi:MAG: FtsW/RodA/SpoVE family cell cycle protein [Lachnospiraceae bacterium]|nr:FtsW/RodA/SpoVE family cell cycle protein [Lachnospiraceae bacterium]